MKRPHIIVIVKGDLKGLSQKLPQVEWHPRRGFPEIKIPNRKYFLCVDFAATRSTYLWHLHGCCGGCRAQAVSNLSIDKEIREAIHGFEHSGGN